MAVDQLIDEYLGKGYEIKSQYPIIGSLRVDLFAVKGNKRIAVEFVDGHTSSESLLRLKRVAEEEGFSLKLIDISKIKIEQKKDDTVKKNKNKSLVSTKNLDGFNL